MKRIIILSFVIMMLFIGCSRSSELLVGDEMKKIDSENIPYTTINTLSSYKIDSDYLIVIVENGVIQKLVEFSPERKCNRVQGLDLIKEDNLNQFLNTDFSKVEKQFGQPHFDAGSGFYIPAYITEDAKLICFEIENNIVFEIFERDLFTNQIINRIS